MLITEDVKIISDELTVRINNVIHDACIRIGDDRPNLAHVLSTVVLMSLTQNIVSFIDTVCATDESRYKFLHHVHESSVKMMEDFLEKKSATKN